MRPAVRLPAKANHIIGPSGLEIVGALPAKLASPDQNASGLEPDGWIADASSFELTRPDAPSIVVIGGMVPMLGDPSFETELRVLIDGEEVARQLCGVGRFRLRVPVPQDREQWRFELHFSDVQHLPAPDGR